MTAPDHALIRRLEHETGVGLPHDDCSHCARTQFWDASRNYALLKRQIRDLEDGMSRGGLTGRR